MSTLASPLVQIFVYQSIVLDMLCQVRNKVLESRGAILSLIGRGIEIVWNLGFYWSTLWYDFLVGRDEEVVPFRARQLRNLLCDLGPSFIKAGQVCPHYAPYILLKCSFVIVVYCICFLFM